MKTYTSTEKTFDNAEAIVSLAYQLATEALEGDGNRLDASHRNLINAMLWTLADSCIGREPGRVAVPADTGLGKSTCLAAFVAAVGVCAAGTPLLILTARVEEGEQLIERACQMAETIDPRMGARVRHQLAHVHSYGGGLRPDDPIALQAPIVVATHARAQLETIRPLLRVADGLDTLRGIIIDEALHKADAFGLTKLELRKALRYAEGELCGELGKELDRWAKTFASRFESVADRLAQAKRGHEHINVPAPESVGSIVAAIKGRKRGQVERDPDNLVALLEHAAIDPTFRVLSSGILQHRRVLPAEFDRCVILDATAEIDALGRLDDHFRLAHERDPKRWQDAQVSKDWSQIAVEYMPTNAGRSSVDASVRDGGWLFAAYVQKLVDLLNELPAEDFVLVCTFKVRTVDSAERLREAVKARLGHGALSRLRFLHFGVHDATSEHRDAAAVVAFGEYNLSHLVATAAALGAMEAEAEAHVDPETVREVMASHVATSLVQLAGRGRCRKVVDGKAQPMRFVYASGSERVRQLVSSQMQGSTQVEWQIPEAGRREIESKRRRTSDSRSKLAEDAVDYLKKVEVGGRDRVLIRDLWRDLNGIHIDGKLRQRALDDALQAAGGWGRAGQHLELVFPN